MPAETFPSLSQMAPSGRSTTRSTKTRRRRRRRQPGRITNLLKKMQHEQISRNDQESSTALPPSCSSITSKRSSKMADIDSEVNEVSSSACSTPKAQRFRIPEISTCPPAPKKPRALPNCSLHRSPIAFFAPPDLELFFFSALRDISV